MTIDDQIRALQAEIDNLYDIYVSEIISLKNEGKLPVSEEKKREIEKKVALKYADTVIEKEDQLALFMLKKEKGI